MEQSMGEQGGEKSFVLLINEINNQKMREKKKCNSNDLNLRIIYLVNNGI